MPPFPYRQWLWPGLALLAGIAGMSAVWVAAAVGGPTRLAPKQGHGDALVIDVGLRDALKDGRSLDLGGLLETLATSGMKPEQLIAFAFHELAGNAEKIGQLNISPDLLRELLTPQPVRK